MSAGLTPASRPKGRSSSPRSRVPVLAWLPGRTMLARFLRHHPDLEGSWSASDLLFRTMPRAGTGIATFEGGVVIRCDFRTHYDRSVFTGREELPERRLLSCLLRTGDRFVDAGANLGLHALLSAARVGPAGRVFAFEPVGETFERLQGNVRASGLERQVEAVPRALADATGRRVSLGGPCHNEMRIGDPDGTGRVRALTLTIDDALAGSAVAGMKIDVEGHEMPVLLGALRTIEAGHPWLLVELNTRLAGVSRLADWDVHRHLVACGYGAHLPSAVVAGDHSALADSWTCKRLHVNLLYWAGDPPAGLGSIRSLQIRDLVDSWVRDVGRASGRRGLLPLASALVGPDTIRRLRSR
ncbi:FkbM family methyltransferase [bacterium]|nr:FkbM family methyltransferase [bacterium]